MALEPTLYLDVAGRSLDGWVRVNVDRSIDNVCIAFGMISSRSWPGLGEGWWIESGDRCTLRLDDEILCTGWLDYVEPGYDHESHVIEMSGRGLLCDLCDCSHPGPFQWKNTAPQKIVEDIAAPFEIKVVVDTDFGAPLDFVIQQGEAGWEAIDRLIRIRQVIAYENPDGSLLITRGSDKVCETALLKGDNGNITNARATWDDRDRFSDYIVKGQQKGKKGAANPRQQAQSVGTVRDDAVKRYRPKILVQSADTNNGDALGRAKWEMQNRWGNSRKAEVTVAGWRMGNGELWPLNRLCDVKDPWLGLRPDRLVITSVNYHIGETGWRTNLVLQPPDALIPEPPSKEPSAKEKKKKKDGSGEPAMWERVRADWMKGEARRQESKQ